MHGDGQVVAAAVLQRLGNLVAAGTVAACLDHSHGLGSGFDEGFEELEIVGQRIQVHLHDGDVLLGLQ